MRLKERSFYLAAGAVAYVALASAQQGGAWLGSVLAIVLPPPLLAWVWRRTDAIRRAHGEVSSLALGCLRLSAWGALLWCAARVGPPGRAAFDFAANVGAACAAVAANVALARLPAASGLLKPTKDAISLDAAGLAAALWGIALALPLLRALLATESVLLDPLATDYATSTACLGSLLVTAAAALRTYLARRLELGVADRARGALALTLAAFGIGVPAAAADIAAPDRTLPVAVLGASLCVVWTTTTADPTRVNHGLRRALALMTFGAPVALTLAVLAHRLPELSGLVTLVAAALATGVGLLAERLARPFAPEQHRWLTALDDASRAANDPDPDHAIVAMLRALAGLEGADARAELWRNDPPLTSSVDAAGYLHGVAGVPPAGLYELAAQEPERTLRRNVVASVGVRRPDARALEAWMAERDAFALTTIVDEQGPIGFLLLPTGARQRALTLEEVRAIRRLADRLGTVLGVSSALLRSRTREQELASRLHAAEQEVARLGALVEHQSEQRRSQLTHALAEGVRRHAYSPAARQAIEHVERAGRAGSDLALVVPRGSDPLGWVALMHRASSRASEQLAVLEATRGELHEPSYWHSEGPALRAAPGGTLFVANVELLPARAQDALALCLEERAALEEPLRFALAVTLGEPVAATLERARLTRALAQHLEPHELRLPSLAERAEDLRALVLDVIDRSWRRPADEPVGIEPAALRALIDYEWPENELELELVLTRATQLARGRRVTLADLASAGFTPLLPPLSASTPGSSPHDPRWPSEGAGSGGPPRRPH